MNGTENALFLNRFWMLIKCGKLFSFFYYLRRNCKKQCYRIIKHCQVLFYKNVTKVLCCCATCVYDVDKIVDKLLESPV